MSLTARFPLGVDPPPETAPVPIAAELNSETGVLTVTFDKALLVKPITAANWYVTLIEGGTQAPDSAAVIAPDKVELTFAGRVEAASVSYTASPQTVQGLNGLYVAAFGFPLS